ncbi:U3 small nucleolar RNA-associated protein 18 homolog isoform X2 [Prorops nasuta]
MANLSKKKNNGYDSEEESRLERLVFGDASEVIQHLANYDDNDAKDKSERTPAWIDEDDEKYTVADALKAQKRKLPGGRPEKTYTELLQNKYKQIVGTPKWAELDRFEEDVSSNELLKHSCHITKIKKRKLLPETEIDLKVLKGLNFKTHNEGPLVTSIEFHPSSTVALVAGTAGIVSIFQVDGTENNKLHSMLYKRFPITKAKFLNDGNQILCSSQYFSHCHLYDLISGATHKIPLPHGIKSMKNFVVSPDGKTYASCGRFGEIYLFDSSSKELITTLKMNYKCNAVTFTQDSNKLITNGNGNEIHIWDIASRRCIHRAIDDGCLSCSTIDLSPNGQFFATGSKQGVVNLYKTSDVMEQKVPVPLKIVQNLVTDITALKFNPTTEILAIASKEKENAFKMLHIPSFTVFSNFPTIETKMSNPIAIDFSPGSAYLGVTNNTFNAFLYRLKHYENY